MRWALSVANIFAIATSVFPARPVSLAQAARATSSRDASSSVAISAIDACTSWKLASGCPNCTRFFT